jgi:hypothetical protein
MCDVKAIRRDAIAAALIHLAASLEDGTVSRDDGDIGAILTCDATHAGLSIYELRELAQSILEREEAI